MTSLSPLPSPPASPTLEHDSSPLGDYLAGKLLVHAAALVPSHSPSPIPYPLLAPSSTHLQSAEAERSFDVLGSPLAMASDDDATLRRKRIRSRDGVSPHSTATDRRRTPEPQQSMSSDPDSLRDVRTPEAGPSRLRQDQSPTRIPSTVRDEFAERFKYLVATSGLLEKTQLAIQGSPLIGADSDERSISQSASSSSHAKAPAETAAGAGGELWRWDIIAALAVLVASLTYMLGPANSVVPLAGLATGVGLYARKTAMQSSSVPAVEEGTAVPDSEPRKSIASERPEADSTGRARVMRGLEALLDESKALDQSVLAALALLAPRPDDTDQAHELRIALHRLFEDMTDSLASATSSLTGMCDRNELTVLADMYDVQLTGSQRRRRASSSDDEDASPSAAQKHIRPRASSSTAAMVSPESIRGSLLSPRERGTPIRALAPSPLDMNDKFTKLPPRASPRFSRTSWSTDWNARSWPYRPESDVRSVEGDDGSDSGVMSATSTESSSMPASLPDDRLYVSALSPPLMSKGLPFTPKRASPLVQTVARLEMPEWSRQPPTPPFPIMNASRPSHSPFRRSLNEIPYIPSPPVSSQEKAQSLAVARATASMSSDKRRSLQTPFHGTIPVLDFGREDVALATSTSLTRARSLPHSEKARVQPSPASLRTSPGNHTAHPDSPGLKRLSLVSDRTRPSTPGSKRTSLLFPDAAHRDAASLGYGRPPIHPGAPSRIPSISPLTLGGLRASCLGVHLKRRRMACCLLGLRFGESEESGYWDEVDLVLRGVMDTMSDALTRLEVLRADAERDNAAVQAIAAAASQGLSPSPSPTRAVPSLIPGNDFAPRDSAEQALLSSMDDLQRLLARVWARTDEVRALVAQGETDFSVVWADMRNDIGNMLRHVDRNRLRLEAEEDEREREETPMPAQLPEFVRAWDDPEPGPGPEEIERLVEEEEDAHDDALPPPGTDEVFEAFIPAASSARQRSTLSREERIQLSREARARGMTMAQLEGSKDPSRAGEIQRQLEAERLRAVSGEMVQELQGMFGAIRRRKGMEEEEEERLV